MAKRLPRPFLWTYNSSYDGPYGIQSTVSVAQLLCASCPVPFQLAHQVARGPSRVRVCSRGVAFLSPSPPFGIGATASVRLITKPLPTRSCSAGWVGAYPFGMLVHPLLAERTCIVQYNTVCKIHDGPGPGPDLTSCRPWEREHSVLPNFFAPGLVLSSAGC